jgi:hypothetical protein
MIHVNVTEHPTAAWAAQHIVDAFPDDTAPRWLLRDRDAIYGDLFRRRVSGMGIGEASLPREKDAPTPRRIQARTEGHVVAFSEVGGLHHRYERRAA